LFTRHFGESGVNALLVDSVDGDAVASKKRLDARLQDDYDVLSLTQEQLRELVEALLRRSFALTHALELLAGLVVVCAMANAASANILDRRDEVADPACPRVAASAVGTTARPRSASSEASAACSVRST